MKTDNKGVLKSISHVKDDDGFSVLRVIVDFYDGNVPDVNNGTVWHRKPVTVIDASVIQQLKQEG